MKKMKKIIALSLVLTTNAICVNQAVASGIPTFDLENWLMSSARKKIELNTYNNSTILNQNYGDVLDSAFNNTMNPYDDFQNYQSVSSFENAQSMSSILRELGITDTDVEDSDSYSQTLAFQYQLDNESYNNDYKKRDELINNLESQMRTAKNQYQKDDLRNAALINSTEIMQKQYQEQHLKDVMQERENLRKEKISAEMRAHMN